MQYRIWAQGGESHCAPEDTMPAYWSALGIGADGIEIGVQLSKDRKLVCCRNSTLTATCGDKRSVGNVTCSQLAKLDAGKKFRSTVLDDQNQPISKHGDDNPWDASTQRNVYHPELSEVLLNFGRRTSLIINLVVSPGDSKTGATALAESVHDAINGYGLHQSAILAGNNEVIKRLRQLDKNLNLALTASTGDSLAAAIKNAKSSKAKYVIVNCEDLLTTTAKPRKSAAQLFGRNLKAIVGSHQMPFALKPKQFQTLVAQKWFAGIICKAVHETVSMRRPQSQVFQDPFSGKTIDQRFWRMGYSKPNKDTKIWQDDGLHIKIRQGGEYSGAAALTSFSLQGDFDARIEFTVNNPQQGTTFELAAIQVDPGYHHLKNSDLTRRNVNLTFDVHGAPPYASSERDENDGFRIGWNNGPAVTQFVQHLPQSSNIYNKYSRDVGDATASNDSGQLRLVRHGYVFNAYFTDSHNEQWVLAGTACVPTLCEEAFLRIGAKHWPKRGKTPPKNEFEFRNFRIYQQNVSE